MGYFGSDGTKSSQGGVGAVYIKLDGGDLSPIYPLRASVTSGAKFCSSPNEKGIDIIDNKVIKARVVTLHGVAKSETWDCLTAARDELKKNKVVRGEYYGKNESYGNMMVEEIEEISSNERYDGVEVRIRLKEYLEPGGS